MNPLVSIITPVYNQERFLEQCITSVVNQTFKNWEMIIIDDGSTDSTDSILREYSHKDERIKVFTHEKNWGINKLGDTYNQALKYSRGDLIAILESDDFWPNYKLEKQIRCFEDKKVVLSFGDFIMIDQRGTPIDLITYHQNNLLLNNRPIGSILNLFSNFSFYLMPMTVMIRKESLLKIGGFIKDKFYLFGIDYPSWLYLSTKGHFCYQREIFGFYRKQAASFWFGIAKNTKTMGREQLQNSFLYFINKNQGVLNSLNIYLNKDTVLQNNKTYLETKARKKKITLLYHYLAFRNMNIAREISKEILFSPSMNIKEKILAGITYIPEKFIIFLTIIRFLSKWILYRLNKP
jgi:glycosyltransferase involved in cell wall biosynthesis